MLAKITIGAAALLLLIPIMIGHSLSSMADALFGSSSNTTADCTKPIADIPPEYCLLYISAATAPPDCPGLDWTVLAAIGKVESDHGRSTLPGVHEGENYAGAGGPMQFLAATFESVIAAHQIRPGGASPPSRYNPHDAIHAAAFLLCDNGVRRGDLRAAVFSYNHADWYVDMVLKQARKYAEAAECNVIQTPNAVTLAAINYACGQRGLPYMWGGDGPQNGDAGFDCSGLTKAAYAAAGVTLPRTAQTQFVAGPRVLAGQPLLPGDLVFYGTPGNIHHVGLYIGGGLMINAPDFGQPVQIDNYRYNGDDYAGATRPAASIAVGSHV
ncbi:NlpC/P60 family protein [Actinophytocola sp. NPDC049390]|uniref:C40 family peptidase n=1 Tax=Actinophytocola sp. NPDC049390 TaxID=3363894 RepID=UPI00379FBD8A